MDEIETIQQLDDDILTWDAAFAAAMIVLNVNILQEVNNLINRLVLRGRLTTTEEWAANMRTLIFWQADLPAIIYRVGFSDLLNGLIVHMGQSAERLNSYYGAIVSDFDAMKYSNVISQLTEQTRTLMAATMEATYSKVVSETLTTAVLTKSTAAELSDVLRAKLLDEGVSTKAVTTTASDALYTFSRGYAQTVAEGLNLKHYYYMGTQIATTRSFCTTRLGKAWTQKEVEEWALLTWAGKIPGTNAQTIYWYVGGFNCRHRLLPISKTMYKTLNNNN